MADSFQVQLDTFTAASAQLRSASAAVAAAAQALSAGLSGTGGMAGADRVGQKFSADYDPAAEALAQLLGRLAPGLGTVADATDVTGENYATSEQRATIRTDR